MRGRKSLRWRTVRSKRDGSAIDEVHVVVADEERVCEVLTAEAVLYEVVDAIMASSAVLAETGRESTVLDEGGGRPRFVTDAGDWHRVDQKSIEGFRHGSVIVDFRRCNVDAPDLLLDDAGDGADCFDEPTRGDAGRLLRCAWDEIAGEPVETLTERLDGDERSRMAAAEKACLDVCHDGTKAVKVPFGVRRDGLAQVLMKLADVRVEEAENVVVEDGRRPEDGVGDHGQVAVEVRS